MTTSLSNKPILRKVFISDFNVYNEALLLRSTLILNSDIPINNLIN